jgi:hypothetical protein
MCSFTLGKELLVPIVEEVGWASEPGRKAWRNEKSLTLSGNRTLLKVELCEFNFSIILNFFQMLSPFIFNFYLSLA